LQDKCNTTSQSKNNSGEIREWKRDNDERVVFNPYYLGAIGWGDEFRVHRTLKYYYWLKDRPSEKYASFIRCSGLRGIFTEDGGRYSDTNIGWVRVKRQKTFAQKEGSQIADEFCPKWSQINRQVFVDTDINEWEDSLMLDY